MLTDAVQQEGVVARVLQQLCLPHRVRLTRMPPELCQHLRRVGARAGICCGSVHGAGHALRFKVTIMVILPVLAMVKGEKIQISRVLGWLCEGFWVYCVKGFGSIM